MPEEDLSKGDRIKRNIEWTLVVLIASAVMGMALFVVLTWKSRADRASCILNIRNVQNAVRSYAGMNNLNIGTPTGLSEIVGPGKFVERIPQCPAGGNYRFLDRQPKIGQLYMECSLCDAPFNHKPNDYTSW